MPYLSNEHLYIDPETGVFRNKLGAKTQAQLDKSEADITYAIIATLEQGSRVKKLIFNAQLLRELHEEIFRDIYDWAGELRKEVISKGNSTFAHPDHIARCLEDALKGVEQDSRLNGSREDLVEALSEYYGELNAVHPFREGNGRAIRTFLFLLAHKHGHTIAWGEMDPDENIRACTLAMSKDMSAMTKMLSKLVVEE